jgi:hypothetical protein
MRLLRGHGPDDSRRIPHRLGVEHDALMPGRMAASRSIPFTIRAKPMQAALSISL